MRLGEVINFVLVDDRNLYKKNHEDFPNFSIDFNLKLFIAAGEWI